MIVLYLLFTINLINKVFSIDTSPIVQTHLGGIKGRYKDSYAGKKYEAYEGIPYAKPPVGKRRFQPPEPITEWFGDLIATKLGDSCLQYAHLPLEAVDKVTGVEDCLYLNVYAPAKKPKNLLPVLFAIHGGGFQFGSAPTDVTFLMDRDIIVVSINYRLGSLGFLSTEDEIVPGNMGLKDQSTALRWVSDNIRSFGGDPAKITLIGISAGGASVNFHYLSPMSKGLFQNGISMSGGVFGPGKHAENMREKTSKLGAILGCPTKFIEETVECLRYRPARSIAEATKHFMGWLYNPFTPFGPVVENTDDNPFMNRSSIEIINDGDAADVPWFTSLVSEEGLYPCAEFVNNDAYLKDLNDNWESIAPHLLDYNFTIPQDKHAEVARKVRKHYFGTKPIDRSTTKELIRCVGDRLYSVDGEKAARSMAITNKSPVYFSYYSYRALHSHSDAMTSSKKDLGVSHSDDWYMLFTNNRSVLPPEKHDDRLMQIKLIDFVTSVMNKGYPDIDVEWKKVDPSQEEVLEFLHFAGPQDLKMNHKSNLGEKNFWSTLDFAENILDDTVEFRGAPGGFVATRG